MWTLIGGQALVAAAAVLAIIARADTPIEPEPIVFVAFTAALFAFSWLPAVHVEFRHQSSLITPTDGAYAIGLLALGPIGFVLAVAAAELLTRTRTVASPVKHVFNLVSLPAGAALGALVYDLTGGSGPLDIRTMVGVALALVVIAIWDGLSTSLVIAITTQEPWRTIVPSIAIPLAIPLPVSIAMGLIALVLVAWSWAALFLLVPVFGLIHGSANAAVRQRAERQRVQRLAKASAELAELADRPELVATIAIQARELVTAVAAVGITVDAQGGVTARLVDDDDTRSVDAPSAGRIMASIERAAPVEHPGHGRLVPEQLADAEPLALPTWSTALWAVHRSEDGSILIVITFRHLMADSGDRHRGDVLTTFVAHASTAIGNASLHADVRDALREEQLLRQRKDEFIATVSHELRTPLTSIGGAIETLRARGQALPLPDRAALLDLAQDHTGRLRGLIEDLLLVAEGDAHALQRRTDIVDVEALLASLARQFRPWGSTPLQIRVELDDHRVISDSDKLRRILAHLLDNAYKFAPNAPVELNVRERDARIQFEVRDHGPGIDARDEDRIFERFVQLDSSTTRARGGLGLGLHLCRQLTETIGGDLQVTSPPDGGASFQLSVPVVDTCGG